MENSLVHSPFSLIENVAFSDCFFIFFRRKLILFYKLLLYHKLWKEN